MRLLFALISLTLLLPVITTAQEREKNSKDTEFTIEASYTVERAAYTRELWVGIPGDAIHEGDVKAGALLSALAKACDDTTSVAVIKPERLDGAGDEREAMAVISGRMALRELTTDLGIMGTEDAHARKHARVVLVGVRETCGIVLRIAKDKFGIADGVLLIDPPVGDLARIEQDARAVGVDVLLHPRSDAEFERETATVVERLGPWGKSARVLRGAGSYDSLKECVADAWRQLRGFELQLEAGQVTAAEFVKSNHSKYRVWHVGELHGNPGAHRLQLEVLRELVALGGPLALSTEQFERDVQVHVDSYLAGKTTEAEFLKNSRPWPNYADYRPLIELCREKKIPVIAGNIPRRLASRVFKEGVDVLEKFTAEERAWAASEIKHPPGEYRDKFMKVMGGADGHNENLERMYASQCIKDDTMAESIANWLKANPKGRVLHINGSFHSAGGLGVPEKLGALVPDLPQAMLTCVEGDEAAKPTADEWIVRVPASRPSRE